MSIALSLLLILIFALGFWIIKESKVPVYLKIISISMFFFFGVMFSIAFDSALGWAAKRGLPEILSIRSVVIQEPNKEANFEGSIFLLLDSAPTKYDSILLNLFGHKTDRFEPRLFKIPYSRPLHEEMQNNVIPKLMKGQIVKGKLGKAGKGGKGKGGKGNGKGNGQGEGEGDGDGDGEGNGQSGRGGRQGGRNSQGGQGGGSESIGEDTTFYELPPSYFLQKHSFRLTFYRT